MGVKDRYHKMREFNQLKENLIWVSKIGPRK